MLGISWAELMVIALVALVVIGPEKLPQTARTLGKMYGKLMRSFNEAQQLVKTEAALLESAELKNKSQQKGNQPKDNQPKDIG
ncbi:MAG: Sec-independent protein translocase protein TatB [Candidatus Adiutrix sp.]